MKNENMIKQQSSASCKKAVSKPVLFHCQKVNGEKDFSIDEWNDSYNEIKLMNLSTKEENEVLFPNPCNKQCFDCMAEVGERRLQTKKLLKNE